MTDRQTIIESAITIFTGSDPISYVNAVLMESGHTQLTCIERRDVLRAALCVTQRMHFVCD